MPSAWDYIDILGSVEKGRQIGAQTHGRRQMQAGDYEAAAATVAPYDPQTANAWAGFGEQRRVREDRRQAQAFDREVAPMIASGDIEAAKNLAVSRRRGSETIMQLMQLGRTMNQEKLDRARENAARTALAIRSMETKPEEERGLEYQLLRERLITEDPTTAQHLPESYNPEVVRNLMMASVDAKEALDQIAAERKANDARFINLSPAEVAARGYRPGTIIQVNPATGREEVNQQPREPTPGLGTSGIPANVVSAERDFSKDWRGVYNNFADIRQQFQRINTSANLKNSAGDLALVVSFTKMLDPGSVAREGEVALTQSTAGLYERVRNLPNTWIEGKTLLTPTVREQLLNAAREMYGVYSQTYHDLAADYRSTAESYGFDPSRVMMGYRPADAGAPAPSAATTPSQTSAPAAPPKPPNVPANAVWDAARNRWTLNPGAR